MLSLETPVVWRIYNWSYLNATYNPDIYRTKATTRYLVICHCHCYPTSFQFHLGELLNIWQICHWSYFNATHDRHTYLLVPASIPPAAATISLKPVLNLANVCSPEHTSDISTNYDSLLNWTFSSPNKVRTVQTLLHSQLACNEMQASARTCGRRAADSMIVNVG